MSAPARKAAFLAQWGQRVIDLLAQRASLPKDELDELMLKVDHLRDARLKELIASLVAWGDAETTEVEYFCLVAVEVMKASRPSIIDQAIKDVELKRRLIQLRNSTPA